jgi:tetratricopeptide (TPR) repeat protein
MGFFDWDVDTVELMKAEKNFGLLISALRYKKDPKVRGAAAKALGDLSGLNVPKEHLIDFLKKDNENELDMHLIEALKDEDVNVRWEAAIALDKRLCIMESKIDIENFIKCPSPKEIAEFVMWKGIMEELAKFLVQNKSDEGSDPDVRDRTLNQLCVSRAMACDIAIKINPLDAKAWYNKGTALDELSRYDDAISAYDKAINLDPQCAEAWNNKGTALGRLGRFDDAIKAYEKAIEINPQYALAWYNIGAVLGKMGRIEDAIKPFDKAIEINSKYAQAWNNKGITLSSLGRYDDAIKAYEEAIKINPKNAFVWYNKGIALFKHNKYEEAIESYDEAIRIRPQNAKAWHEKFIALQKLHRESEAATAFIKAIEMGYREESPL